MFISNRFANAFSSCKSGFVTTPNGGRAIYVSLRCSQLTTSIILEEKLPTRTSSVNDATHIFPHRTCRVRLANRLLLQAVHRHNDAPSHLDGLPTRQNHSACVQRVCCMSRNEAQSALNQLLVFDSHCKAETHSRLYNIKAHRVCAKNSMTWKLQKG